MRFNTTSELSLGGEKAGAVEGEAAAGAAAAGGVALEAPPCDKAEPLNRTRDARTRAPDRGVRREAKLKIVLLDVGVRRSLPQSRREARSVSHSSIGESQGVQQLINSAIFLLPVPPKIDIKFSKC
jgi:hypothetical protein